MMLRFRVSSDDRETEMPVRELHDRERADLLRQDEVPMKRAERSLKVDKYEACYYHLMPDGSVTMQSFKLPHIVSEDFGYDGELLQ